MKRRSLMLILIAIGALFQQLMPGIAMLGGMKPPILGAMALYHAFHKGTPDLWIAVFFAALLQDGLSCGSFGPALLAFPAIAQGAYRVRNELFVDGMVTQLFTGAVMGLFTAFVTIIFHSIVGQLMLPAGLIFIRLFGSLLLGMLTLPAISFLIHRIEAAIPTRREHGWQ